jgi:hypothetical protein
MSELFQYDNSKLFVGETCETALTNVQIGCIGVDGVITEGCLCF